MGIKKYRPVVLVIFDGWGICPPSRGNAIDLAKTPVYDSLVQDYPVLSLQASGEAVGSSWGELGNSEVGHLNIGAGKIVYQDSPRITKTISDGTFNNNEALKKAASQARKNNSQLHIMGLMSSGGVHSFNEHAYALLEFAKEEKLKKVFIHAFLDGRDTPHNSAERFITKLQDKINKIGVGKIASLSGRYWAMDRDNHWERIAKAYRAIVEGKAETTSHDPIKAIQDSYIKKVFDEEIEPTVITNEDGSPVATVADNDAVIFFNFRPDRSRELTKAFVLPGFEKFERKYLKDLFFVTLTQYEKDLPVDIAFPPEKNDFPLARVISDAGMKQLHIAETEKYAHVTFFLNGGREQAYPGEERVLIPSPSVANYDLKPSMSAREITDRVVQEMKTAKYDFIVINYANADMVGHTGNFKATVEAVEVIDECLGKIYEIIKEIGGVLLITADHGNAEDVVNLQTGFIQKEHTTNPVPFILIGEDFKQTSQKSGTAKDLSLQTPSGILADIAPTVLHLLGLTPAASMSGKNLITIISQKRAR
ncbi:MAG: 2,3-bisphosphoglycerate-independent phosphoglycerate mutase [bacterium]